jgi:hypothetical protein
MKNAKRSSVAVSILLSTAAIAWAQQFSVRPGEYETTVEMQLPGAPKPMLHKALSCITASDARDVHRTLSKALAEAQQGQCKISNEKNSASRLDFDMVCVDDDGTRSSTRVETTFADAAYEQVAITKMGRDVITMKTKAKWLRATCSRESMADDEE